MSRDRSFRALRRTGLAARGTTVAAWVALTACGQDPTAENLRLVRRDSAGVEIVELQGDPWSVPARMSLDTTPVFRVEPDDERPETLFGIVQDAVRLGDGRVAVLDRRRYQIFLFGADGSTLRTIGRRGQGPGEFRFPTRLLRRGRDSIGVADGARVEVFPIAPGDPRRVDLPAARTGHTMQAFGVLANGDYLTIASQSSVESRAGRNILYSTIGSAGPDGTSRRTLGRHVSSEFTYRPGGADGLMEVMTLFWEDPAGGVLPDGYVWCLSTEFDCQIWSAGGAHVRTIRATAKPPAVTDQDIDALTATWLEGRTTRVDSTETRKAIEAAHRMERMPALSALRTDARGRIWMRSYVADGNEGPARWLVFEASGRLLGTMTIPGGLHVFDIGDDYVLGTERDADDAQRIVMYRYSAPR